MLSIEITEILRANILGLSHQHIRLLAVSLKNLNLEKSPVSPQFYYVNFKLQICSH